jgi:Protein of unknown function (DUF3631)
VTDLHAFVAQDDAPDAEGADNLARLHAALTRYVVFPSPEAADAVALWITATHAQPAWEHATRLAIISPEKRCGKSRLLDVIEATCHAPLMTVNISPAALVRSISDNPPTLLLDEADTVFGRRAGDQHEDLRGIINSGHQRNRPYIRWDVTARETEKCPTFAMAALASIGDLPDTIMDRSIVIRMRRRAPSENVAPYRTRRDSPRLRDLGEWVHDWAERNGDELRDAEPEMPVEDRAADTWEPLVAVADLVGGEWPERARAAVRRLVRAEATVDMEANLGMRLLGDISTLFAEFTVSFMQSAELVNRLRKVDDAPWQERDLNTTALAGMLRPYGIRPGHNSARTMRGYDKAFFADAFARYLPSEPGPSRPQADDQHKQPDGFDASDGSTRPAGTTRPSEPAGQAAHGQVRTGTDDRAPETGRRP